MVNKQGLHAFLESQLTRLLLSFVSGSLLVTSFAPFNLWPFAFLSVAALFALCWSSSPKQAFFLGLIFGLGVYLTGVSWVYVSLSTYGGMPLWMGIIAVFGFSLTLSLFIGMACFTACKLTQPNSDLRMLALVPSWTVFEWGKSWVLTGFPWIDLGYSQTTTWFFSLAPIGGVYLIGFSVALVAALLVNIAFTKRRIVSLCVIAALVAISAVGLNLEWSSPSGEPLNVGVVQGNVEIDKKWQPQYRDQVIAKLFGLSQKLHNQNATDSSQPLDLVVWPETALPLYYQQTDAAFWRDASPAGTAFITGLMDAPSYPQSYNSAVLSCEGSQQLYHKRHLVPFGEYLPLRFLFNWVLVYLDLPMSDLLAGEGVKELRCGDKLKIGLSICYEDTFAAEMRAYSGDATLLVNISEDAWFGDSLAPHQRLQIAQMRARELSRPLVRSANTGPSVVIDHQGKILAATEQFEATTLISAVQPQFGDTLFKRFGNWIVWLSWALLVFFAVLNLNRARIKL